MKALYGKKVGMTRIFTEDGESVAVTVLEVGPNVVHQVKTPEKDGYSAIQLGFGSRKAQRLNKAETGHFTLAQKGLPKFVGEVRFDKKGQETIAADKKDYVVGDVISVDDLFAVGQKIDVVGTSKGKGFAGVIKRHHMKGAQTQTHGTHEYFRHGGSIGCRKFPGRVFKNKRMAGHMGDVRVMQQGLEIVSVRSGENLVLVKVSVPGAKNSEVLVRSSIKA